MSRKRNEFGCAPNLEKDLCAYHGAALVNRNGCDHGDPQGGFRWRAAKKAKARPIVLDVEVEGGELAVDLLDGGVEPAKVEAIQARARGNYYRLHLTFNKRGKIERAQILPFTDAYLKRVEGE